MCTYMCVDMCMYVYVYVYVCVCLSLSVYIYIYIHMCMHIYIYIHIEREVYPYINNIFLSLSLSIYIYIYTYVYTSLRATRATTEGRPRGVARKIGQAIKSQSERFPDHRHRNLKPFEEHTQTHDYDCFVLFEFFWVSG